MRFLCWNLARRFSVFVICLKYVFGAAAQFVFAVWQIVLIENHVDLNNPTGVAHIRVQVAGHSRPRDPCGASCAAAGFAEGALELDGAADGCRMATRSLRVCRICLEAIVCSTVFVRAPAQMLTYGITAGSSPPESNRVDAIFQGKVLSLRESRNAGSACRSRPT